jgi:A/G-specific adenine glycosylase
LFTSEEALRQSLPVHSRDTLQCEPAFIHVLTHKDLHLHVCRVRLAAGASLADGRWVAKQDWPALGLPAPVRKLLERG